MSTRGQHEEDDFSEADRRAIAEIRRQLDAEFGPLESAAPLQPDASPPLRGEPQPPLREAPPLSLRLERPSPLREGPSPPRRARPAPERLARPRRRAPAGPLFLLGVFVGGAVGGIAGGLTTLLWLEYLEPPPVRSPVSVTDQTAPATDSPAAAPRERADERAAVDAALNEWLAATKAGDVEAQMRFYPPRVPVYYTWRNVTRQAVRDEKQRVFDGATRLEISTDTPTTELLDNGAGAVSRFRKRYVIEGPRLRRRGEVLQELRWARTADGWRIVSERDAEVLTPSASVGPERRRRGGTIDPAR
jgi:ketosteroid isomerase-like protein